MIPTIPKKHHLTSIQLIVEKAFGAINWYGCNVQTMVTIKALIITVTRKAFWFGYQEAMRDMSENEYNEKQGTVN